MPLVLAFIFSYLSSTSFGSLRPLLSCLGQEELIVHKSKSNGPIYYLNQALISELAAMSDLKIKARHLRRICGHKRLAPSLAFTKELFLKGHEIFEPRKTPQKQEAQKTQTNYLRDQNVVLFFNYLSRLHAKVHIPKGKYLEQRTFLPCFESQISELKSFSEAYAFTRTEVKHADDLFKNKARIRGLFRKLQGLDKIRETCRKWSKGSSKKGR